MSKLNEHLISEIPNNVFTHWFVKKINQRMKKSNSRYRLRKRFRKPIDGFYDRGDVRCANAETFSLYLRKLD